MPLTMPEIWVHATDDKGQLLQLCQGRFRLGIRKNYSLQEWLNTPQRTQGVTIPGSAEKTKQRWHLLVWLRWSRWELMTLELFSSPTD